MLHKKAGSGLLFFVKYASFFQKFFAKMPHRDAHFVRYIGCHGERTPVIRPRFTGGSITGGWKAG